MPSRQRSAASNPWKIDGKYKLGDRVTTYGDEDEGISPIIGTVVRLQQQGAEPIVYTVRADSDGKEWLMFEVDLCHEGERL